MEPFEPFGKITGPQEGLRVRVALVGGFVVNVFNRCFLHRAVQAFDLAVGPGVGGLGDALPDALFAAELPTGVAAEVGVLRQVSELNGGVGPQLVYLAGHLGQHPPQEVHGEGLRGLRVQLSEAKARLLVRSRAMTGYCLPSSGRTPAKSTCREPRG